jgi:hypothetical protein
MAAVAEEEDAVAATPTGRGGMLFAQSMHLLHRLSPSTLEVYGVVHFPSVVHFSQYQLPVLVLYHRAARHCQVELQGWLKAQAVRAGNSK